MSLIHRIFHLLILLATTVVSLHCARNTDFLYQQPNPKVVSQKKAGPGWFEGQITEPAGQAVENVGVALYSQKNSQLVGSATTDRLGHFRTATISPGAYFATFQRSAYGPLSNVPVVIAGGRATVFNAAITKLPGSVRGHVTETFRGTALSGVTVNIHVAGSSTPIRSTTQTDTNGGYLFENLPEGTYTLDFMMSGYISASGNTRIIAGQVSTLDMRLVPARGILYGNVRNGIDQSALPNVKVSVHAEGRGSAVTATAVTNSRGDYVVNNLPEGNHSVDFELDGFTSVLDANANIVAALNTRLDMVLGSTFAMLRGTVKDAQNGYGLPGVKVTTSGPSALTTTTDPYGRYSFAGVAPGNYKVNFDLDGYVPVVDAPATLTAGRISTLDETMTKRLKVGELRIVLNWTRQKNGAVQDVDSYLKVPDSSHYAINFNYKSGDGADLDVDNTNWEGPETITITEMRSGAYVYYVNNYNLRCDKTALGNSEVVIHVYDRTGLIKTYNVPPGKGITYEVLRIVNRKVVDVKQYNDSLHVEPSRNDRCP
jgi:5-hydroxyisourate hydrolase-like protein (transthyretin family)